MHKKQIPCYNCKKITSDIFCCSKCEEDYIDKHEDSAVIKKINYILNKYNHISPIKGKIL